MIFSIGPEALLTSLVLLFAVLIPTLGQSLFRRSMAAFSRLARKRRTSVFLCGILALGLRVSILPILPFPIPHVHDEFSYLLAADTFSHGRLTNLTPPMWVHFETLHVIFVPTYQSMYPPLQGLILAVGQTLAGYPFWGVWLSVGAMCAAICWMLQAWVPPVWALIGGLLPVLRFGVFSWGESYWGGAGAAIGGALVLGAMPRIIRCLRARDALILSLGVGMLINSRPYEGLVLCLPVGVLLMGCVIKKGRHGVSASILLRRVVLPTGCSLLIVGAMTSYYFFRVTGSPFRMPYQVNRDAYSMGRYFFWQGPHAVAPYRHDELRRFYQNEFDRYQRHRSLSGFLWETGFKIGLSWLFYFGPALTVSLFALPWVWRDRRIRPLVVIGAVGVVGIEMVIYFAPHYAAPFTCVIIAFVIQGLRHLRVWKSGNRPVGAFLSHATVFLCVLMLPIQIAVLWARHRSPNWRPEGIDRQTMLDHLRSLPGDQLVLVRYKPDHDVLSEEWVYNEADIDHSKVIWARDMNPRANQELLRYYPSRKVWLIEADAAPPSLQSYTSHNADGSEGGISLGLPRN
jgi:hypothetical protein